MKKLILLFSVAFVFNGASQNFTESNYLFNPLIFNPAYAGSGGVPNVSVGYLTPAIVNNLSQNSFYFQLNHLSKTIVLLLD